MIGIGDATQVVLAALADPDGGARFVADLVAELGPRGVGPGPVEEALRDLEEVGRVLVRDHLCADPCLADADLRIAALVAATPGDDGVSLAVRRIEAVWQVWLADFLASHRCS